MDVGCGEGRFGEYLLHHGFSEVVGIEPFAQAAHVARGRLSNVTCSTFQEADKSSLGLFDIICFADSIEHMVDPWAALRESRSMLEQGGALLLSVPNVSHWTVLWRALNFGRWDYEDSGVLDRTHLRFFTPATISDAVQASGYRIVATGGVGEEAYPLPRKRQWLRPLIARKWPHILVYQYFVLAVPAEG